ncbi:hypothetical protein A3A76_03740 [Candidatus Woesebacteria bacterium RIFCSPLOWO2_01_FULL_39_23]|uniref:Glycosyltransferase 2-like domain-containing protein n=1 Tax=Candidatus Woesebacteria bacterium RIFCSPHIGHO2_01_FULL_40_22 TaxID=1802499 RepID=A0A1F7YJQ1_9BACT|nr:MAG: hypothetical protein A2141_00285 [Candidatus Woesebacteria bacterium RBG_16_40_11]OGM27566.1 MAG: hypothetical protein A2628_02140 [Candidatus Woesebacteria bacterium RIFCSPHIGHO2_01_FULL_40_22]OGM36720.1 MAG: hypothetical protein A3E41_02985 [Candidatus Woesebacteria bacterium RIFCSPHIGHO2_12_FULL_38_9]OGM62740.1 MAG: hypothetical protein A3A76_03740 [Candidatus Woesebacteria bacterium RIFCSPLOWO2_01_FULL_39_23]
MKIFIVIPTYNESKHIKKVLEGVKKTGYDIVVVDDGSTDNTNAIAKPYATVIKHKVNLGKGAAMKSGASYAFANGAEAVIFIDSDGQHNPDDISKFIEKLEKGKCEVVFGVRRIARDVPVIRGMGNRIGIVLVYLLFGIKVSDLLCGFRAITQAAFKEIIWSSTGYAVETEMVVRCAKRNLKHCSVTVQTIYLDGVKGVTILDAFSIFFDVIKWRFSL